MEEKRYIEYDPFIEDDQSHIRALNKISKFDFTDTQQVGENEILEILKVYYCDKKSKSNIDSQYINIVITEEGEPCLSVRFACVNVEDNVLHKIYHILITAYDVWQEVTSENHQTTFVKLEKPTNAWRELMIKTFKELYYISLIRHIEKSANRLKREIDAKASEEMRIAEGYASGAGVV